MSKKAELLKQIEQMKARVELEALAAFLIKGGVDIRRLMDGDLTVMDEVLGQDTDPLHKTQALLACLTLGILPDIPNRSAPTFEKFKSLIEQVEVPELAQPFVKAVLEVMEEGLEEVEAT